MKNTESKFSSKQLIKNSVWKSDKVIFSEYGFIVCRPGERVLVTKVTTSTDGITSRVMIRPLQLNHRTNVLYHEHADHEFIHYFTFENYPSIELASSTIY